MLLSLNCGILHILHLVALLKIHRASLSKIVQLMYLLCDNDNVVILRCSFSAQF